MGVSLSPSVRKSGRWTDEPDSGGVRSDGCTDETKRDKNGLRGGEYNLGDEQTHC